jgi:hypothetical protein
MGDDTVKLLMFSDIEGCQAWNLAGPDRGTFKQSGFLCNPAFYAEIKRRLDSDSNLNIAFLGDYFDQGMGVYESIKGMNGLLTDYNKGGKSNKDGKDKVFVILGNRDVNKLRFCYELAKKGIVGLVKGNRWEAGFGAFYDNLNGKEDVALANCILFHSMNAKIDMNSHGINSEPDAKLIGLHSFLPSSLSDEEKQDSLLALKYLKVSLGIIPKDEDTQDALDLLGFFEKCKLAHVFDGPGGKVLLAHGGGFDSDAFCGKAYVDSFGKGMLDDIKPEEYHITMEKFRRILSGNETVMVGGKPVMNGGYDRELANAVGNAYSAQNAKNMGRTGDKLLSLEKQYVKERPYVEEEQIQGKLVEVIEQPVEEQSLVEKSVKVYNDLLKTVIGELKENPPRFTWRFVLLQALGLKPDGHPNDKDARYKSLIQSCSQDGCSGPNNNLSTDEGGTKLKKILNDSGITHVSYGHKPICFPIPVIYRRKGIDGVTFISNDTSNGNRKVEEIGENTAIGTMVIFDPNGVQSKIEPIELGAREGKVSLYEEMYKPLTLATTPFYQQDAGANFLQYGDDKVVFNKSGYDQLKFEVMQSTPTGGRRRSRNRKYNTKKRGSKHVSKRTKRNKRHAKRSRKQRKY